MMLAWPESQYRLPSGCGKMVTGGSPGLSVGGVVSVAAWYSVQRGNVGLRLDWDAKLKVSLIESGVCGSGADASSKASGVNVFPCADAAAGTMAGHAASARASDLRMLTRGLVIRLSKGRFFKGNKNFLKLYYTGVGYSQTEENEHGASGP